jgi:Tfp pilus assembly protein PilO
MRLRIAIFLLILAGVSALAFVGVFRPQTTKISDTRKETEATKERISQLQLELGQLQALQKQAPELRARAQRVDAAIPSDPQLAQFILQVQDAATKSGIDWMSVSPTPPAPAAATGTQGGTGQPQGGTQGQPQGAVSEVAINMSVNGGYFQVQDFLTRLETLGRAVKISGVTLAPGSAGLPQLAASLTMKMFVASVPAT